LNRLAIYKDNYTKLTNPFAKSKNAGIQSRNTGSMKKIERMSNIEEKMSIPLRTSPVKIKSPFRNSKPAQNSSSCV